MEILNQNSSKFYSSGPNYPIIFHDELELNNQGRREGEGGNF